MFGELDTYALSNFMPMEPEVYKRLFVRQNQAVWPSQLLSFGLTIVALTLAWRPGTTYPFRVLVGATLGGCWAWVGFTFHIQLYSELNWAATYMGWAFIAQGALMLTWGLQGKLERAPGPAGFSRFIGAGLMVFACIVYPLLGPATGRSWPGIELFGTTPDPTAIGTLGLLLLPRRMPLLLAIIPVLWCIYSGITWWAMKWPPGLAPGVAVLAFLVALITGFLRR